MSFTIRHISIAKIIDWYEKEGLKNVLFYLNKSDAFNIDSRNDSEQFAEKILQCYYDKNHEMMEILIEKANIYYK